MNFKSFCTSLIMVFVMLTALGVTPAAADTDLQGRTITVTVSDKLGPVPGANVVVVGATIGGATDENGVITLSKVPANAVLEVSFVGYITQKVSVGTRAAVKVFLEEDTQKIDEAVVVAYGHQKKITVTGAIETVSNEQLIETQVPNFASALAGRVSGLTTIQESGQPGNDAITVYLRGQGTTSNNAPLLLIDGVPSDEKADKLSMLNVNEVASVTVLKDASSTAIFGSRGANGVILITTRRGEAGKNVLSAQFTTSVAALHFPMDKINSWDHATLRNQARLNDGLKPDFTPYQIAKMREQSGDPFFPNRDVYKESIRKFAPTERFNVEISGGSKKTRYYTNANIIYQDGNARILPKKVLGYNCQYNMLRYTIRNNFDFNINEDFKMSLNLSIYFQRTTQPNGADTNGLFFAALATPPSNPGPLTAAGYTDSEGNPVPAGEVVARKGTTYLSSWAECNRSGYYTNTNFSLISQFSAEYDLSKILKGLSTKVNVAYNDFAGGALLGVINGYDAYSYYQAMNPGEKSYYIPTRINTNETFSIGERQVYGNQMLMLMFTTNYFQQFGDHTISAMIYAQSDSRMDNTMNKLTPTRSSLPHKYAGISGRVTWDYKNKYMAEFNAGYNGSEQFAKDYRFGFFPAGSAGWVVSNEEFMKNITWLDLMKFRGSVGLVGNDSLGGERFLYYSTISRSDAGISSSLNSGAGVVMSYIGNPTISWENVLKQNYAVEFKFFKHLTASVDYFTEYCGNRLYMPASLPQASGLQSSSIPRQNLGKSRNHGYEIELGWAKEFSQNFHLNVSGQYSFAKSKIIYCDEVELDPTYLYRKRVEGFMPGQQWGYSIDYSNGNGYINTPEELEWATNSYDLGTPRLGDFLYKDTNNDGRINERDLVPIKYSAIPLASYGFNITMQYKRFGMVAQFNGVAGASAYRMGMGVSENQSYGIYTDYHLKAWTKERYESGEKIEYPALTTQSSSVSLQQNDFFINNRSYLRLKNLTFSYSLPQNNLFKSLGVSSGNIYLYGNNVFIIDNQRVKAVDAETSGQSVSYPLNRTYTLGLNVKF